MPAKTKHEVDPSGTRYTLALLSFFLSGAAGLIYEITWIRKASLAFGSTTYALSIVLAVFFLGLAIGSHVFGRLTPRIGRPLRVFAALEIGVALFAALSIVLFPLAESLYGSVYRASGGGGEVLWVMRFALVSLILLPPTVMMGGTLPLFCRQFVIDRHRIAGSVGLLYGVNTLGAAAGCLLAGFVLIPLIGVRASILAGVVLNVIAALVVGSMDAAPRPLTEAPPPRLPKATRASRTLVAALFFFTGFAVLGHEVLWTRFLALLIRNTVYTYTITLGVVLLGIVIGSVVASRFIDRAGARARVLGALQAALGISVMGLMSLPPAQWARLGTVEVVFMLLLVPAVLSGASFPLVVRMIVDEPRLAGAGVGRMAAINTAGGIAGSLAVGLLLLPSLGLEAAARITTGTSLAIGAIAWLALDRAPLVARAAAVAVSMVLWIVIPNLTGVRLPADHLAARDRLVDYREGLESNLAVVRVEGSIHLEIDRWWQGEIDKTHQIMAAHVPMMLHHDPRRVLVVGVGAGQTPERFLMYAIDRLDCVDIEPAVFDILRRHFPSEWMDDPRVHLIRADGRDFVAHGAEPFDIISLELGQIFRPGVAAFYSTDFYRQVRSRLAPDGLVSQFVSVPFLTPDMLRGVVRSFIEVFPASVLWYNTSELLLIGINGEHVSVDPDRLRALTDNEAVREDLRYSQWGGSEYWLNQPHAFLGGVLAGPRGLARLAEGGHLYRDDRPLLAYHAGASAPQWGSDNEFDFLDALRSNLEPAVDALGIEVDADSAALIERVRELNIGDIAASAVLRRFNEVRAAWPPERLLSLAEHALSANPENVVANRVTGEALMLLSRLGEAERYLSKAVVLAPEDHRAQKSLAIVLHRQRRVDEAIPHYRAAVALRPDADLHHNLALALLATGDVPSARVELEEALRLDPDHAPSAKRLLEIAAP